MIPGYLHIDCRRGLKADLLNAALSSLLPDHGLPKKAIASLGIDGLSYVVSGENIGSLKGHALHFLYDGNDVFSTELPEKVFGSSLVNLLDLQNFLDEKSLSPSVNALAQKILAMLITDIFTEHKVLQKDALFIVCHIVLFSALVDALDPKFITATKICMGEDLHFGPVNILSLTDSRWLNQILQRIPTIEVDDTILIDVVGVASVKALAGHVGARGESRVHKVGIGLKPSSSLLLPHTTEALWCEASLPLSMTEHGLNNLPRLDLLHEIAGSINATADVTQIASWMSLHGATAITWHLAQRDKGATCYLMRFLVRDEDRRDAVEAFLIKACAFDVTVAQVLRHDLNKRLVSVPIGTGNKASTARFVEYIYLDKIVRTEPVKEDLDLYVQKTDYSVDVARSDLMLAWKKWRGRVVSEDA